MLNKEQKTSTGNRSTGNRSTGHCSTGHCSTGHWSTGDYSTGSCSTGSCSTGHRSTGDYSTGHYSTGNFSTGSHSTGHRSTGDWSISNFSSGHFSTIDHSGFGAFNKPCTPKEWDSAKKPEFLYFDLTVWVYSDSMTDVEKEDHPHHEVNGGYLKQLDYKSAFKSAYESATEEEKQQLLNLPNFDSDVFKEISGVDVNACSKEKQLMIRLQSLEDEIREIRSQL